MLNILTDWSKNSVPYGLPFHTPEGLTKKVDLEGHILPFRGITVVFRLKPHVIEHLTELQNRLYEAAGHLLAERLDPESFHMTLHDIAAAPPCDQIETDIEYYQPRLCDSLTQLQRSVRSVDGPEQIPVHGTHTFNMCHTSVVLGVTAEEPHDDLLCAFHDHFNSIVDLGETWTPHITLAYFKPRGHWEDGHWIPEAYTEVELAPLRQILAEDLFAFELHLEDLEIQTFNDMNHYETIQ